MHVCILGAAPDTPSFAIACGDNRRLFRAAKAFFTSKACGRRADRALFSKPCERVWQREPFLRRRAAIVVLAVKTTRFAGGFAGLDRSARRWPFAFMSFGERRGLLGRTVHQRTWQPLAAPPRRSHPEGTETKCRSGAACGRMLRIRLDLTASRRRGPRRVTASWYFTSRSAHNAMTCAEIPRNDARVHPTAYPRGRSRPPGRDIQMTVCASVEWRDRWPLPCVSSTNAKLPA